MFTYSTKGTCSRQILFDVDESNKMHNVRFIGGCGGLYENKLIFSGNVSRHRDYKKIKDFFFF